MMCNLGIFHKLNSLMSLYSFVFFLFLFFFLFSSLCMHECFFSLAGVEYLKLIHILYQASLTV